MSLIPDIDISGEQWEIVRRILQTHVPDYEVWAFGSRTQGTAKKFSDLDIVVVTDIRLPIQVSAELDDSFIESDLPWKVDILDWSTIDDSFRRIILKNHVVVQSSKSVKSNRL